MNLRGSGEYTTSWAFRTGREWNSSTDRIRSMAPERLIFSMNSYIGRSVETGPPFIFAGAKSAHSKGTHMNNGLPNMNRRQVLAGLGATAALTISEGTAAFPQPVPSGQEPPSTDPNENKALIAITYDLEMSGHYPTWDQLEWNFEKGLLDDASKEYTVKAARRVKAA